MIRNGEVLKGFHAKTSFVPKKEYRDRNIQTCDFEKYAVDEPKRAKIRQISEQNKRAKETLNEYRRKESITHLRNEEDGIQTLPPFKVAEGFSGNTKASTDTIKERRGNVNMMLDSLNDPVHKKSTNVDSSFEEGFEVLPGSMLSAVGKNRPS
jgi:hypothetical protein